MSQPIKLGDLVALTYQGKLHVGYIAAIGSAGGIACCVRAIPVEPGRGANLLVSVLGIQSVLIMGVRPSDLLILGAIATGAPAEVGSDAHTPGDGAVT